MSSGLQAVLCLTSEVCPEYEWQNSVLCPTHDQCPGERPVGWRQNSALRRGMSSVRVEELCRSSGVFSVSLEAELCPE
ncbi:hypothetical protein TNCV_4396361 [Trichonephila clavipes]|uniref:Uncharacterized protein n=1 Tax=Trichonephila clavipes TaxID=2585209 RepID=A0A8X6W4Y9_TRICX|nr:hypothetical protein TNCV_4396361 [Trichonephila clavipes]